MASAKDVKLMKQILEWSQDYGREVRPKSDALSRALRNSDEDSPTKAAEALLELMLTPIRPSARVAFKKQARSVLWAAKDLLKLLQKSGGSAMQAAIGSAQLALAAVHLKRTEPDAPIAALKAAMEARTLAQTLANPHLESKALVLMMEAYGMKVAMSPFDDAAKMEDLEKANEMGSAACNILQELGEQEQEAEAMYRNAEMLLSVVREDAYMQAESLAEEANLLFRELNKHQRELEAMQLIIGARLQLTGTGEAIRTCQEAIRDCSRETGPRKGMVGKLRMMLGSIYLGADPPNVNAAATAASEAIEDFKDAGDNRGAGEATLMLASIQRGTGDWGEALNSLQRAAQGIQRSSDERLQARLLLEQAKAQFSKLLSEVEADTASEREGQALVHGLTAETVRRAAEENLQLAKKAENLMQSIDDQDGVEEVRSGIRECFDRFVSFYKSVEPPSQVLTYVEEDGRTHKKTERLWNLEEVVPSIQVAKAKKDAELTTPAPVAPAAG